MAYGRRGIAEEGAPSRGPLAKAPEPEEPVKCVDLKVGSLTISSEAREDPNEGRDFGDSPVHCTCPHCERTVMTFMDHEASWVTWLLASIVWFSLGWMALWVLPLLWPAFKDVVHHCPRCLNVVARQSRIKLPTFRSEVMTVKVGSCAVVLARKYVMILAGLIVVIATVGVLRSTVSLRDQAPRQRIPKGPLSHLTWEDFLHQCGPRQSLRHRSTVARSFEEKFRRRTFEWQGEVQTIREGVDVFVMRTKSVVMVRMHPQRFPRRDVPDIALLFDEEQNRQVAELNPGDQIQFLATMNSHGHADDPEVMMMWNITVKPKPSQLFSTPDQDSIEVSSDLEHGNNADAEVIPGANNASAPDQASSKSLTPFKASSEATSDEKARNEATIAAETSSKAATDIMASSEVSGEAAASAQASGAAGVAAKANSVAVESAKAGDEVAASAQASGDAVAAAAAAAAVSNEAADSAKVSNEAAIAVKLSSETVADADVSAKAAAAAAAPQSNKTLEHGS